jgi:hypothetical protein
LRITLEMIEAPRRAEFGFYQRGCRLGADRFIPIPDQVIRVISEVTLGAVPDEPVAPGPAAAIPAAVTKPGSAIVRASKPRPRR